MNIDRKGATRVVFLIGGYAVKVPVFRYGIQAFLTGMLANLNESRWRGVSKNMPRTVYCNRFGLVLVAKRCRPVQHRGLFYVALAELIATSDVAAEFWLSDCKPENYGFIGADLIKLDAGE